MGFSRILLTGACGFIGRHICELAQDQGYTVYGSISSTDRTQGSSPDTISRMAVIQTIWRASYETVRPEICIHAAGRASVADSIKHPGKDFRAGPVLTFELLDVLRRQAPDCRFLLLSSAAVYGNSESLPVTETHTAAPISPYGFHKLQCELLCREFTRAYDVRTSVIRIFSAYGEGLRRQVLWDICRQLVTDGAVALRGTGLETRDYPRQRCGSRRAPSGGAWADDGRRLQPRERSRN